MCNLLVPKTNRGVKKQLITRLFTRHSVKALLIDNLAECTGSASAISAVAEARICGATTEVML